MSKSSDAEDVIGCMGVVLLAVFMLWLSYIAAVLVARLTLWFATTAKLWPFE